MFDNFYYSVCDIFITFVYLKLSFIFYVMNISFFLYKVIIALYMHHHPINATKPVRVKFQQKIMSFLLPKEWGLKKFLIIQDTLV